MAANFNRKVMSRVDARKNGLLKYFTGKQCQNGHKAQRYTANNKCVACVTDTPVIQSKLFDMAAAAAKRQNLKFDIIPTPTGPPKPNPPLKYKTK